MSEVIETAVAALSEKLNGPFEGTAKFVLGDEGSIILDGDGVRAGDGAADVTLTADPATFAEILNGETNPTAAFMGGKLTVDGDMGLAMTLGNLLS